MVEVFLEERLKEASVLPLWLHLRRATAYEPRPTEKPCMWFLRELKTCCQLRLVTAAVIQDCHRQHRGCGESPGRFQADADPLPHKQTRQDC